MKKYQTGAALLTALFIMTLIAIVAVAMSSQMRIAIHQTELAINTNQLYFSAQGVTYWAKDQLLQNYTKHKKNQLIDKLPLHFSKLQFHGVVVNGTLMDAQAKYNINNLEDPTYIPSFARLIHSVDPKIARKQALTIATQISEWITPQQPALRNTISNSTTQAAHQLLSSRSELLLVPKMTHQLYVKLSPYIIALPKITPININTASAPVLMSLAAKLTLKDANRLIAARKKKQGFKSTAALTQLPQMAKLKINAKTMTVKSSFFLVRAITRLGPQQLISYDLLQRKVIKKKAHIVVLKHSENAL